MKKTNNITFLEYLKTDKFHNKIHKRIFDFCCSHKDFILDHISNGNNISYIKEIDDLELDYKTVWIDDKENSRIDFDIVIIVNVYFSASSGKYRDIDCYSSSFWVIVSCTGTLDKQLTDFKILVVDEYNSLSPTKPMSNFLIPYIHKNEYHKHATEFLDKYYPEALKEAQQIDVNKLAKRMGLKVYSASITKEKKVFGLVFFDEAKVPLFNKITDTYEEHLIKKDSIIVDDEATYLKSYGSRNMTLVHECLHSYLHRKAFQFAKMINSNLKYIECKVDDVMGKNQLSQIDWMEIQANGITPHVLMPLETFKSETYKILEDYGIDLSMPFLEKIEDVIVTLSKKFGTTIYSTRKRLIDIGFEFAIGTFNWVDDHYIRPYKFKNGSLEFNETYSISYKDVYQQLLSDKSPVMTSIIRGQLQFVENHLVVNSDKYIENDKNGEAILTEYARYHMDECCIKFRYRSKNKYSSNNEFGLMCYLCRDCSKELEFDLLISNNLPLILNDPHLASRYKIHNENVREVCDAINRMNFCEILNYLMKYLSIDIKELVYDSGLSDKTIRRYLKPANRGGNRVPEKRTVVSILRALNLPPQITNICIRQAQLNFALGNKEDDALSMILHSFRLGTYRDVDKFLISLGFQPISEK